MRERANTLRHNPTTAENHLWIRIRNRQICNCEFLRQYTLGKYIVDFVCLEKYLIIELDGSHHLGQISYDAERTKYLGDLGFQVIRFWNNEIFQNTRAVLEKIYMCLT